MISIHKLIHRNLDTGIYRRLGWLFATAVLVLCCSRPASAADAILSWSANTETNLAGYRVYYGQASRTYAAVINVGVATTYTVTGLSPGTYYFALTAYNTAGAESGYSNEVSKVVADTTPPVISAVAAASVTGSGATISWTTNEPATSQVRYGTTTAYGLQTVEDPALVGAHQRTLTGLSASTTYHYQVVSRDGAGNVSLSADRTFSTLPPPDTTAPTISAVTAASITTIGATITWTTNEAATTQVQYGTTTAYGSTTTLNTAFLTVHSQALSGLVASTTYNFRVLSRDAAGNLATSANFTFRTLAAADTTPPTISAVAATNVTSTAATIVWTTNEAATTQVQYGPTTAYGFTTTLNSALLTSHSQALAALTASTTYHFHVLSRDAAGNTATSTDQIFQTAPAVAHLNFTYASRTALLADAWSYVAKTASGTARNTEQTGSLAANYNQTTHPGTIRLPLGNGEIWQAINSSQNMLFRTLPTNWTSIRLKIAAFSPVSDFQQVGLIAYQDDDNYVNVQRNYNSASGGPVVGFFKEAQSVATRTDRRILANTGNLILRLDRDPATNTFRAYYSTTDGATWVQLTGTPILALTNPRLAIQVGANAAGTLPTADLAWVEIR